LLLPRNGALGVDLVYIRLGLVGGGIEAGTYDLTVEVMLLYHDDVDALGVLEGEETEAAGATGGRVTHYGAFADFTELREVALERICLW
jgi:hypothetical protein